MAPGYTFKLGGQTKILDETTANLMMAIGLASIFVYMVLAAQSESFVQPTIIMLVLPLSVPFALFTLWATGRTLNLWSALGMFLLLGIVKRNSILQVGYANVLRARGVPLEVAIVEACRTRLRPILMTTSAIIGGQSLCLFLTLLVVAVAYVKLEAIERSAVNRRLRLLAARISTATSGRFRPAQETPLDPRLRTGPAHPCPTRSR